MNRSHRLNIGLSFAIAGTFILAGLIVTFLILYLSFTPEQIAMAYLPPSPDPMMVEVMIHNLGLDQPLFFQFFGYFFQFLFFDYGISSAINQGMPVFVMLVQYFPRLLEVLFLPLCIGISLGYLFGRISKRSKRNWLKNIIQLMSALFLAIPVFLFGMYLQYTFGYLIPWFPATGFKNFAFPNPPVITGSRIFDSMLSQQWYLIPDTLYHYVLPMIILTIAITALMTRFYSSNMTKDSHKKKSIFSRTAKTSAGFGVILTYFIMIDITFGLHGFGDLLVTAIMYMDFFVIRGVLFTIIVWLAITLLVSNFGFSIYRGIKDLPPIEEQEETTEREYDLSGKGEFRNYLKQIVKSPLTIIGIVAVLVPIVVSIIPELISGYSFHATLGVYMNSWAPPSPGHLLGTAQFGRDVLALISWGTADALLFGAVTILIGLCGGLIFGLLASKLTRIVPTLIKIVMLVFYVLPAIVLVILFVMSLGREVWLLVLIIGLLLIPGFTRIIANTEFRILPIVKKVIAYAPLFAAFSILLYVSLGFLGFADPHTIQLGALMAQGRVHLYDAPWASLWPGFMIFLILACLFLLHQGLAQHTR